MTDTYVHGENTSLIRLPLLMRSAIIDNSIIIILGVHLIDWQRSSPKYCCMLYCITVLLNEIWLNLDLGRLVYSKVYKYVKDTWPIPNWLCRTDTEVILFCSPEAVKIKVLHLSLYYSVPRTSTMRFLARVSHMHKNNRIPGYMHIFWMNIPRKCIALMNRSVYNGIIGEQWAEQLWNLVAAWEGEPQP